METQELLDEYNTYYKETSTHLICCCLNPAHEDSSPSMSIRKTDGAFRCFGCGIKGYYPQLYKLVTGKYVEKNIDSYWNKPTLQRIEKIYEDPEIKIIGKLKDPLKNENIRKFLSMIGIISDTFIKDRNIQYSTYTEMIASHLMKVDNIEYTKMYNRITIPIYKNNKLINVEGRVYDDISKLPEGTPKILYVRGGSTNYLYNWENIDITKPVVTTESIKNFFKIWNVYTNCVAMFRNIPSEHQLELLNTVDVIHFGDNDAGFFGIEENNIVKRKGTIQYFEENLNKDFKICFDKRVFRKPNGIVKGYDANNCTLQEIEKHLDTAVYYSEYKYKLLDKKKIITW